jgi:D-glycero-alpha-D-manno-heptose-7-phosphate kinase
VIISKTPFRVSLAGGGSDLAEYYRHGAGNVISLAIDRHMYVTVNRRFDQSIRVSYTRTETVDHVDELQHDLIREAMKMSGVTSGVEITTIADLPAGIGLGSSSTLIVGTLNALYALKGEWKSPGELAARACRIEIDVLGRPIGKQDQYIAAFGGLQDIRFNPDGSVFVHPVICPTSCRQQLSKRLMLFFTGIQRDAGSVLHEARRHMASSPEARATIDGLVALAGDVRASLAAGKVGRVGELLDTSWRLKKRMASGVSNGRLDRLYATAMKAGASGGKVAGAGGGGCLLLCVDPRSRPRVRASMIRAGLREVPFAIDPEGSRIVHYSV